MIYKGTWPWEYTETVPRDEPVRRSPDPVRDLRELTKALRSLQSQVEVLSDLIEGVRSGVSSHEKLLSRIGAYEVRDAE